MENKYREYRTGQGVPKAGAYICQSGKKASMNKGENFPECPISGQDTYWKHENDE
ncbi:hypothetical protein [Ornithinibacillus xuwenensis]|uniref:Uncharacterized protein n=1 Tax=Ornithinibacillus xuwenensis TaxID=3144668 RepID=A0ABU9XGM7_9BACI